MLPNVLVTPRDDQHKGRPHNGKDDGGGMPADCRKTGGHIGHGLHTVGHAVGAPTAGSSAERHQRGRQERRLPTHPGERAPDWTIGPLIAPVPSGRPLGRREGKIGTSERPRWHLGSWAGVLKYLHRNISSLVDSANNAPILPEDTDFRGRLSTIVSGKDRT